MEPKGYLPKSHVDILPCMAAFAVVVETGSFIEASVKLGVTASAISKQVTKLESALSLRLLERSTRNLKINAEGEEIYAHCKSVLDSSANMFRVKERFLESPQGLIRVAVPKSLYALCSKLMPRFLVAHSGVNVHLICGEKFDFIADAIDVGIVITDRPPLGMVARKLFDVDFVVCATDGYLKLHNAPNHPSELVGHSCIPFIGSPDRQCWKFISGNEECDVSVAGRYLSECPEATLTATLSGLGISCMPICMAAEAIESRRLCRLLPGWVFKGASQGAAWVVYQPGRFVPKKVKIIVEFLLDELIVLSNDWHTKIVAGAGSMEECRNG